MQRNKRKLLIYIAVMMGCVLTSCFASSPRMPGGRPNILFVITDDQLWEHAGCYGDKALRTPAIDRLAEGGVRFENAYCAAPSCSPSRAAILTGQDVFRLEEAGVLTGYIRDKFEVFPLMLERSGYSIGSTGKGYAPRKSDVADSHENPIGRKHYMKERIEAPQGVSSIDYAANFDVFLDEIPKDKPFFFWIGVIEPHLPHPTGLGETTGIDLANIRIPDFYPDVPDVRKGLSDYMAEIEWADKMLDRIIKALEARRLIDDTIVVFTSDNGMPFPRAKATLYDAGVRMPLIVNWPKHIKGDRVVNDPVSLIDLAPTFLELAELDVPEMMTGRSLNPILFSDKEGDVDPSREFVVTAFEKHTLARPGLLGFPRRAIHTRGWSYIRNYEPDRYPAGNSNTYLPDWGIYGDIDPSIIKSFFTRDNYFSDKERFLQLSFGKVPAEELYNKERDPDMLNNLAANPDCREIVNELRGKLEAYLIKNEDPRMNGLSPWDNYNFDRPFPIVTPYPE